MPEIAVGPRRSEQVGSLIAALVEAQGELKPAVKGRTAQVKSDKGSYSYTYVTLTELWELIRPTLSKHGLAVTQNPQMDDTHVAVATTLWHKSGEFLEFDRVTIPLGNRPTPQQVGSAITYARRYSLVCALGLVAEDDDDAQEASREWPRRDQAPRQKRNGASRARVIGDSDYERGNGNAPATENQLGLLERLTKSSAVTQNQRDWYERHRDSLTKAKASELIDKLTKQVREAPVPTETTELVNDDMPEEDAVPALNTESLNEMPSALAPEEDDLPF